MGQREQAEFRCKLRTRDDDESLLPDLMAHRAEINSIERLVISMG